MTKLFSILKTFKAKELVSLNQFLENPLVNQRVDVLKLLSFWQKTGSSLTKEAGFESIYPGEQFNLKKWHLLTSRLFKLIEQFLIARELKQDVALQKSLLAKAYRNRQVMPLFESTIDQAKKVLNKTNIQNANWLHQKFGLEYAYYDYISSHNRKGKTNLQNVNDLLDEYYVSTKLRNACLYLTRKTINDDNYTIHFIEEILEKVEVVPNLLKVPAISVYYYCYRALTEKDNVEWFVLFRKSIEANSKRFEPSEKRDISIMAINYCIRKLNTGDQFFIRETFELYKLSLQEGYLIEDKKMPESLFYNIVAAAVKNKEYLWAKDFIEEHKKYLPKHFQDPIYYYSHGLLFYEQGQHKESMQSLVMVDTKISFLLLATKTLQVKIYYELQELDALDNLLESLRVYVQRRKDLGYRKENFENLVNFVRRLMSIPYKSESEKRKLKQEVQNAAIFTEKDWLLTQLLV